MVNKYIYMSKDSTTVRTLTASSIPLPLNSPPTQNAQPLPLRLATTVNMEEHARVFALQT